MEKCSVLKELNIILNVQDLFRMGFHLRSKKYYGSPFIQLFYFTRKFVLKSYMGWKTKEVFQRPIFC